MPAMTLQRLALIVAAAFLVAPPSAEAAADADGTAAVQLAVSASATRVDDATIEKLRRLHHVENHQVRLVLLPTSVTDRKGRSVQGLDVDDFRLFEDQVAQEIRFFSSEAREPIHVAFVLDVSGSMRQMDKMEHAKEAIRQFVDGLRPDDRFALICFADGQVAWVTEFTGDRSNFLRRLAVQEGYGQTALNDAVAAAPELVDSEIRGRKAIVLITDGVDNASKLTTEDAVRIARRVHVPIYTIGFLSVAPQLLPKGVLETNLDVLNHVSEETGGRLFAVHDPMDLKEAVASVDAELRHQYLIGYYPPHASIDGQYHHLRVEARKSRVDVRTRKGYWARP